MKKAAIISAIALATSIGGQAFAQQVINVSQFMNSNISANTVGIAHNVCCSVGFSALAGANSSEVTGTASTVLWTNDQRFRGDATATTVGQVGNIGGDVSLSSTAFANNASGSLAGAHEVGIYNIQHNWIDPSAYTTGNVFNIGGNAVATAQANGNILNASAPDAATFNVGSQQHGGAAINAGVNLTAQNITGDVMGSARGFGNSMTLSAGGNMIISGQQNMVAPINTNTFISAHNVGGSVIGSSVSIGNVFSVGKP